MGRDSKQFRSNFRQALPSRIYELENTWRALRSRGGGISLLTELHGKVGNLVVLGSVSGAVSLSMAARTLERLLDEALQTPNSFDDERQLQFERHLNRFIKQASLWQDESSIDEEEPPVADTLVYLLTDSRDLEHELERLSTCGYKLTVFNNVTEMLEQAKESPPAAVLMDVAVAEGDKAVELLDQLASLTAPLMVVSVDTSISARLMAVRLGSVRFFPRPIDMAKLKATLDGMTTRLPSKPYRVLVVEDEQPVAECYAAILRQAGMEVELLCRPLEIFTTLQNFEPELVLMDIVMPGCDGLELASVLRQEEGYNQMPIVFLSGESDLGKRLAAMNLGGDEFIAKPTDAGYLVSVVSARVKRKRWVERLNEELHISMRESEYLRVAMNHHVILSITDVRGDILFVNEKFCEISGYLPADLLGRNHRIIKSDFHSDSFYRDLWSTISRGDVWQGEVCNHKKNGDKYWVESTIVPFLDEQGVPYQYVSVRTDITHIKDAEERLIQARDSAERANQAKTEFISHMSHELRTPLNAILGYAQLFEYDQELDERQHKSAQEIYRAGQHLLGLVNEVLDLSRIERGCLELSIESVKLGQLIDECKQLLALQVRERSIRFEVDSCESVVKADYTRLKQVLLNLLTNAIKYNNPYGFIGVKCCSENEHMIRIAISDSGNGIPRERLDELFQPFNRLGEELGEVEGAGIGLALSKQLIEMMGGLIGVKSEVGKGSCFWFEIPLADPAIQHTAQERDVMDEEVPPILNNGQLRRICYVEDNPANLRLMERVIGQHGQIEMSHAVTAEEGLELIREELPELVLMDINLPGMDGYEALSVLKNDPKTQHIPVMAITANAMPQDVERGYREGFVEYMTKPLNIKLFLETLDRLLDIKDGSEGE